MGKMLQSPDHQGEIYICAWQYNPWGRNFGRALGAKQGCSSQNALCTLQCSERRIPRGRIVGLLAPVRDQCPWQHLRLNKGGGFDTGPSLVVTLANRLVDLEHIGPKPGTALVVLILRSEWAHEIMDGASRRARPVARNPSRRERQPNKAPKAKNTRPESDQGQ